MTGPDGADGIGDRPDTGPVDLPGSGPTIRLAWGGASDVGRIREVNQDSLLLGPEVLVVADGMGGHAGGEVASRLAVDTIGAEIPPSVDRPLRVLDLVAAVQTANDVVWEQSSQDPALAGMGTTVVAIARVVEDGEERLAIVNVGDSRAYRWSEGYLDQVSDDHSLVGDLVRAGRLSPEEARVHPQKNIVTRAIGIEEYVDVDEFQLLPRTGDRYVLCSDGLTDEATEADIAGVLRTEEDPAVAARALVALANEHGGRDNITVVVVDVVDDGLSETARAALPDDHAFSAHPDADTQSLAPVDPDLLAEDDEDDDGGRRGGGGGTGRFGRQRADDARPPRAVTLRSLAFILAVLALVGTGGALAWNYARNTYVVTVADDEVTIFRGRPGGVLWFDPTFVEGTGIALDDVPAADRDDLAEGVTQPSLTAARRYVANLEERIADFTPPVTTPSRSPSTTSSTTTPPAARPTTSTTGP